MERINETIQKIAVNPLGYAMVIDNVRRANIRRFPMALWFLVEPDESIVIACLDGRRNPVLAIHRARGRYRDPSETSWARTVTARPSSWVPASTVILIHGFRRLPG